MAWAFVPFSQEFRAMVSSTLLTASRRESVSLTASAPPISSSAAQNTRMMLIDRWFDAGIGGGFVYEVQEDKGDAGSMEREVGVNCTFCPGKT
jgi:hypothetical protein